MAKMTNMLRWTAALLLAVGALNMIYFAAEPISRFLPSWQLIAMNVKGFAYLGAAFSLATKRIRQFSYFVVAELVTVFLSWGALYEATPAPVHIYSRALVIEDSVIILVVIAVTYVAKKIFERRLSGA